MRKTPVQAHYPASSMVMPLQSLIEYIYLIRNSFYEKILFREKSNHTCKLVFQIRMSYKRSGYPDEREERNITSRDEE
jgi:hypothetical protein